MREDSFDTQLREQGEDVEYIEARMCSCLGETGQADPDCSCINGYYYSAPKAFRALRQSYDEKILHTEWGKIFIGGAKFTIPKIYEKNEQTVFRRCARGDIFIINKVRRERDILKRGERERINAFEVKEILSVANRATLYSTEDYSINEVSFSAGTLTEIEWVEDKGPEEGEHYTVEFLCKEQYVVWDGGAMRRGTSDCELPILVPCQLRKYFQPEKSVIHESITRQYFSEKPEGIIL